MTYQKINVLTELRKLADGKPRKARQQLSRAVQSGLSRMGCGTGTLRNWSGSTNFQSANPIAAIPGTVRF